MAYALVFTDDYTRRALRFLKRHPELKNQYAKTLALLEINPHHPSLRLHALAGRLQGVHSVSINLSYRITLELMIQDKHMKYLKIVLVKIVKNLVLGMKV